MSECLAFDDFDSVFFFGCRQSVTIPADSWRYEGLHFPRPTSTETAVAAVPGAEGVGRVGDVVRFDT